MTRVDRKMTGLAKRRKICGYTQQDMADALGVERGTVSMWEIGKTWPPARLLPLIADLLLCSIDDLYKMPPDEADGLESAV